MRLNFLAAPAGCLIIVAHIGAALLHLWTILIAWQASGFVAALISFCLPVLSQIYWFAITWRTLGFLNPYTITVLAIVGLYIVGGTVVVLTDRPDEQKD